MAVDDQMLAVRKGQAAGNALEILARDLDELDSAVDKRIYAKLQQGEEVSPQEALQAWLEKYGYHRIRKKLHRDVRVGRRAAEVIGEDPEV